MPGDTLPKLAQIDLQPLRDSLDSLKRLRLELGATPAEFAHEHLGDARPEMVEAMKWLDSSEDRDLHLRVGNLINDLDDCRAQLAKRYGS